MSTDIATPLAGGTGISGPVQTSSIVPVSGPFAVRLEALETALGTLGDQAEQLADALHVQALSPASSAWTPTLTRAAEALTAHLFAVRAELSVLAAEVRPALATGGAR
ncbi:MAG: hypothetical protein GC151_13220 [Betaproteobacteria bacterium]|nr:hypothetical protein [Betaproteobacteria bacterium]